jgi:hypothetical protein
MSRSATDAGAALAEARAALEAGRLDEAGRLCRAILADAPDDPGAQHLHGIVAFRSGDAKGGAALLERAIAHAPANAVYRRDLCEMLRVLGRLDEALAQGRRAVALAPDDAGAHYNLGIVHYDRCELEAAIACQRRATQIAPDHAAAHFELAEALLLSGDLARGWPEYEWRYRMPGAPALLPPTERPQWNGEAAGPVLLIADQGFGDTIQFARYIPAASRRCARLLVACSAEMETLIAPLPGIARISRNWQDIGAFDAYAPLSSLPYLFGTDLASIPPSVPYLRAEPARSARWRDRLDRLVSASHRRIGLVWAGRPSHGNDANRSLPLERLAPLAALDGTTLIALQTGPARRQIGGFYAMLPLLNLGPELADFADTAAVVDALDLVISVDTAVAHLCGALAKPVWLLLPFAPDWRWLLGRDDSPWYPTMRLFRQQAPGDWAAVVASVVDRLRRGREERRGQAISSTGTILRSSAPR